MCKFLYQSLLVVILSLILGGCATSSTPSLPPSTATESAKGIPISDRYVVGLSDGRQPIVYLSKGQDAVNLKKSSAWARFDLVASLAVTVARKDGVPIKSFKVLPSSAEIPATIKDGKLEVKIDRPRQLALVIDNDWDHPCMLFADPPSIVNDPPRPSPNLLFFGPGLHRAGEIQLKSNMTVYFAEGSYVLGRIFGRNLDNVRIIGRGMLSGERYSEKTEHLVMLRDCTNVVVEGLTLLNSGHYNLTLSGRNNIIRWVKIIGWRLGSDGIAVGESGRVHDCFIKTNDDALKLYHTGMVVERCVIWQMHSGAPFQISWNLDTERKNVVARDIDIVRCEHENDWDGTALFTSVHGGAGKLHHYLFEDIRIENSDYRLLSLQVKFNEWAKSPQLGAIYRITFRNIKASKPFRMPSRIKGHESTHGILENIAFEGLVIGGKLITKAEEAYIQVDEKTAWGITFEPLTKPVLPSSQ